MGTVLGILLLLYGVLLVDSIPGERVRVRISVSGDTVVMRFLLPDPTLVLEGFLLGYGHTPGATNLVTLPAHGAPYQLETEAEPKYLLAVRPVPRKSVEKHCTGVVSLDRPPLVAGSLSPTTVLLSWGGPSDGKAGVMEECLEEGFYTVRYRGRGRGGAWAYQNSPTAAAVVSDLRPAVRYEFGVRSTRGQRHGPWSKPVLHSTGLGDKNQRKAVKMRNPLANPLKPVGPRAMFPPRPALHNRTHPPITSLINHQTLPGSPRTSIGYPVRPAIPANKIPNLVDKPGDKDQPSNWKQTERLSGLKPNPPAGTPKEQEERQTTRTRTTTTTTSTPTTTTTTSTTPTTTSTTTTTSMAGGLELWEQSEVFSSQPNSDLDALGKKRFVAPHVVYKTDKKPEEPCSVTTSLEYFPGEQPSESDASAPPQAPPSNLTVVTVEGCPSFIILDWKNTDNHTQEYEVISTATGPDGEEVSVLTTNQTHTVVENLRPESSYEFKVMPKNDLGAGPPTEPVAFSTESADPRVSENASGKAAIWTRFPFRTDPPSECTGRQYIKRTWYRKFVGVQLCNSLRYKIYLSDSLTGRFYDIGDEAGFGEDHCQFVDSFLDATTGPQLRPQQLPPRTGFYRAERQEPVRFGPLGAGAHAGYVSWYECGMPIPGRW